VGKPRAQSSYYEIAYTGTRCMYKNARTPLFVYDVQSGDFSDDRRLRVSEQGVARFSNEQKFLSLPSEIVYKNLMAAMYDSCDYRPVLTRTRETMTLKTLLMDMSVVDNAAVVALGYEFASAGKTKRSGIARHSVPVGADGAMRAIERALNLAISQIQSGNL